jgi:N-acetylglucosaminyldiphosphoundecaprenol N-acetyl-beta-D-mannosaminyltransferase
MTRLLGLNFTDFSLENATQWVLDRPPQVAFDYVVTPNADHLVRLRRRPELAPLYRDAALCCLDSRVVAAAACVLGLTTPPVVTGSDLVAAVLRLLPPGEAITVVGMRRASLNALIVRTDMAPPAHYDPPFGFDQRCAEMQRAVEFVLAHPARLVLLAVGSPRQEKLAAAIKATRQATGLGLCIGASLDFISGAARRAPAWMRGAGLEWAHRLARDPRRLARRYLWDDPPVFAMLLQERLRRL